MVKQKSFWLGLLIMIMIIGACSNAKDAGESSKEDNDMDENEAQELAYNPPSLDDLDPDDPKTEYVKYGEELFNETHVVLDEYVGNELSCQSCHADGGLSNASSMVGVTTQFPQYRPREGVVFTLEDRINGCMMRSMNGEKIPQDSKEMRALISYLTYISEGIEVGEEIPWRMLNTMKEIPEPDVARGEELYQEKNCLSCHAVDGSGTGANTGPALWGDDSFNDGAGLARMVKMAGYLKNNMPPGDEFELSDQEAADLAAFILSHERPEWESHDKDWPEGGRPTDIITKDRREKIREGTFDWTEIENIIPAKK
ncbi:MAG TPA: c-type cytochrome [Cerasibacillus sp.]|uniref:c-type cytochrome n=1 Tax=Cerasibacillus sp. TaxID=2498711 RepID=UPI002F414056